ncbi:MAG: UDP-N-acetylmuramoyl-L-alanine--D-glutamate ligase [Verrucomicrobiales bacterium]
MKYAGQRIAILGLGSSGRGAARLARKFGAEVAVFDSGGENQLDPAARELRNEGIRVVLGVEAAPAGERFDLCVLSPGIDPAWEMPRSFAAAGAQIIGEIEFGFQNTDKPVVAITGTNGKSTTTELTSRLLNAGEFLTLPSGNHGRAFADVLWAEEPLDVHTLEVSSFQLETICEFRPRVAVWLNFAPDHLDRHRDLESYFAAKARVFENQRSNDWAIVKLGDRRPANIRAQMVTFSAFSQEADFRLERNEVFFRDERILDFSMTRLRGKHNVENVMAAFGVGRAFDIPWTVLAEAAKDYRPPRHRCELVAVVDGREFINDSKATNLHALESCLRALEAPVVLIAGGKDKGLDFSPLREAVQRMTTHVFAIGQLRDHLAEVWADVTAVEKCPTLEAAVQRGYEASRPGQVVLLSPGTSSFDMFTGYDHRGDVFTQAAQRLLSPV